MSRILRVCVRMVLMSAALQACGGSDAPRPNPLGSGANASGTSPSSSTSAGSGGNAARNSSGGSAGQAGNDFSNPDNVLPMTPGMTTGKPVGTACVGQMQVAQQVQVDMYIMLDRSGSMLGTTGAGPTKWDAIRQALGSFVQDPQSSGLGVGLQYFPLGLPGIPESCMVDSDCGPKGGQCSAKACLPPVFGRVPQFTQCFSDADCPFNSQGCAPFGLCSSDQTLACFDIGAGGCQDQGDCEPFAGECSDFASCVVADYGKPAVPIANLPANATPLIGSLNSVKPLGLTPTPAALAGALQLASDQAKQHPDHRVITVLATDGIPTQCLPIDVQTAAEAITTTAGIASAGVSGTPSIATYVIGVFAPDDLDSQSNLDRLAVSGGTKKAFIVDDSQDVSAQLTAALATIRGGTLACDAALPKAPAGQTLDFTQVNVQFKMSSGSSADLLYVTDTSGCSKAPLGWFYDADPAKGQTPTRITICPSTCDTLQGATGASLEIKLGCATLSPE